MANDELQDERNGPPTPVFFVTAHSKGVAGENLISAHSKGFARELLVTAHSAGLKVAVFSMSWEWLVSADSKGFIRALSILISILLGTAHSKGVRRSVWRARMVRRARKDRADLQDHYSILVPYVNDYFKWFGCCGIEGCQFDRAPGNT